MARDEASEQQAMTAERLAEIQAHAAVFDYGEDNADIDMIHELLADNERLRAREAVLLTVVRVVANMEHRVGWAETLTLGAYDALIEQARALLASADESERSGGDGGCLYCGAVVPGWGDAMGCVCETCAARE